MEENHFKKSMARTFELLDTVDIEKLIFKECQTREIETYDLMGKLEDILEDEVTKYPELEGFLFDCVNDVEFIEYIEDRYKGRLGNREVIKNYISII